MTLWGGRFQSEMDNEAFSYNSSLAVDKRLAIQDIQVSRAWAMGLAEANIISTDELEHILEGLQRIEGEFRADSFSFRPSDEDIHTAVERRLTELIGAIGEKLHTGRSRNDQVVSDFRLWLLENIPVLEKEILFFQRSLIHRAEQDFEIIIPGFTHLQPGQPVLLSHWWLSFFWSLHRDLQRFQEIKKRTSSLPLGSGALAGTSYPINRQYLLNILNFETLSENSIDAVADRDFAAEFLFSSALIGIHISKLAEAIVIFTNPQFGFFSIPDAYASGSSMMPQKKNPDIFELARGKAGTLIGLLIGLLATLKGLPTSYDKDLQEDKFPVFQSFDVITSTLSVLSNALQCLKINQQAIEGTLKSELMATDLADYFVRKGIPFRQAHKLVGQLILSAAKNNITIDNLPFIEFKAVCESVSEDIYQIFDPERSINLRNCFGGTSRSSVLTQISRAKSLCGSL